MAFIETVNRFSTRLITKSLYARKRKSVHVLIISVKTTIVTDNVVAQTTSVIATTMRSSSLAALAVINDTYINDPAYNPAYETWEKSHCGQCGRQCRPAVIQTMPVMAMPAASPEVGPSVKGTWDAP